MFLIPNSSATGVSEGPDQMRGIRTRATPSRKPRLESLLPPTIVEALVFKEGKWSRLAATNLTRGKGRNTRINPYYYASKNASHSKECYRCEDISLRDVWISRTTPQIKPFFYSFFLNQLPMVVPNGAITQRAPPTMLPRVTGMRFLRNICPMVISAPRMIPRGMINMLAIE